MMITIGSMAQSKKPVRVKLLTEKSAIGDLILARKIKKDQLDEAPQILGNKEVMNKQTQTRLVEPKK